MVLIAKDGTYIIESDINKPVIPERAPTNTEIKAALAVLKQDLQTQEMAMLAANATVSLQMQMAQKMSEQAQNAQITQMLNKGK